MTKATEAAAIAKAMKAFTDAYAAEMARRGAQFARELNAAFERATR